MHRRLLITGTGRSGTFYVHRLLQNLGLDATHEILYGPGGPSTWPADRDAESSWLAVPYLDDVPDDVLIVHQVRDPIEVGRSFLGRPFFRSGDPATPYNTFVLRHSPHVFELRDARIRFIRHYLDWNAKAEAKAERRHRLEDLRSAAEVRQLLDAIGVDRSEAVVSQAIAKTSRRLNAGPRDESFSWTTLPKVPESKEFRALAQRYGYGPSRKSKT